MARLNIVKGQRFGKLIILNEMDVLILPSGQPNRVFNCLCDCGNKNIVRLVHLSAGKISSCGCLGSVRDNEYRTPIYSTYRAMINRTKENYSQSEYYFYKGISVCEEWKNDFNSFKKWAIDNNHKKGLQLDRIDNDKGYSPNNCRLVNSVINANNKSTNLIVLYKGTEYSFRLLLDKLNKRGDWNAIYRRIKSGWEHEKAIDTPIRKINKNMTNL